MAEVLEASGKTVDAALETALAQLGVDASQVDYEVIEQPSRGFFGLFGGKPARIRVTAKASAAVCRESEPAVQAEAPAAAGPAISLAEQTQRAEDFLRDVFAAMKGGHPVPSDRRPSGHPDRQAWADAGFPPVSGQSGSQSWHLGKPCAHHHRYRGLPLAP